MLVRVIATCAGVIALAFIAGWMLPATREGRATTSIMAPPDRILAVIAEVEAQPDWRAGVASVQRQGEGWVETTGRGERITFQPIEMSHPACICGLRPMRAIMENGTPR